VNPELELLQYPLLHLSLFFKEHRARYYELLQEVRLKGHWESWLDFFLQGVRDIAERTASDIQQSLALYEKAGSAFRKWGAPPVRAPASMSK
jgi:Fic family protein